MGHRPGKKNIETSPPLEISEQEVVRREERAEKTSTASKEKRLWLDEDVSKQMLQQHFGYFFAAVIDFNKWPFGIEPVNKGSPTTH